MTTFDSSDSEKDTFLLNWPDRNNFVTQRNFFTSENLESTFEVLKKEGFPEELLVGLAEIILRGLFVKNVMSEKTKIDQKINVSLKWEKEMSKSHRAGIIPLFFINGTEFTDYAQLLVAAQKNFEGIELRGVYIGVNVIEILGALRQANRWYQLSLDREPGNIKAAEEIKRELIEELAIKTEASIVHELSHALFFHSIFGHKQKFLHWLEEHQGYSSKFPKSEELIPIYTPEERALVANNYSNKRIERTGDVLQRLFLAKYYPDFDERTI